MFTSPWDQLDWVMLGVLLNFLLLLITIGIVSDIRRRQDHRYVTNP